MLLRLEDYPFIFIKKSEFMKQAVMNIKLLEKP
jgi:hypothetical protein